MEMMTIDLIGNPLHYAVARMLGAEMKPNSIGAQHAYLDGKYIGGFVTRTERGVSMPSDVFAPSRVVAYGAQIGERILEERITSLQRTEDGWCAVSKGDKPAHGESMRIAGLRAALRDHFGTTVDIPEWLD